ncbi:MAG: redoxin domain-containing protein [Proteobacteria bacterium]|nr:redoxin domain-containing protein [Pseudomonadota bacterium]
MHEPAKPPRGFKDVDMDTTKGVAPDGSIVVKTDGTEFQLEQLWAKDRVLLVFYLGGWCPHCKRQLETLQQYQKDIGAAGAVIAAISVDTPDKAKELHDNLKLQFELYSDANLATIQKWGVEDTANHTAVPATFIIEKGGAITYRRVGKSPTDRPTVEELLAALQNSQ